MSDQEKSLCILCILAMHSCDLQERIGSATAETHAIRQEIVRLLAIIAEVTSQRGTP